MNIEAVALFIKFSRGELWENGAEGAKSGKMHPRRSTCKKNPQNSINMLSPLANCRALYSMMDTDYLSGIYVCIWQAPVGGQLFRLTADIRRTYPMTELPYNSEIDPNFDHSPRLSKFRIFCQNLFFGCFLVIFRLFRQKKIYRVDLS